MQYLGPISHGMMQQQWILFVIGHSGLDIVLCTFEHVFVYIYSHHASWREKSKSISIRYYYYNYHVQICVLSGTPRAQREKFLRKQRILNVSSAIIWVSWLLTKLVSIWFLTEEQQFSFQQSSNTSWI